MEVDRGLQGDPKMYGISQSRKFLWDPAFSHCPHPKAWEKPKIGEINEGLELPILQKRFML